MANDTQSVMASILAMLEGMGVSPDELDASGSLDMTLNSLQFVTLLVDIENQFGIEFADDVLVDGSFASVQTLAEVVVALGNRDS